MNRLENLVEKSRAENIANFKGKMAKPFKKEKARKENLANFKGKKAAPFKKEKCKEESTSMSRLESLLS